jgi:Cu/Ag efflux protein CusF
MMSSWLGPLRALTMLGAVTLIIAACEGRSPPAPADAADATRTYAARGVVLQVAGDALTIRHEAIDDFAGPDGRIVGMDPMAMRFHLAPRSAPATFKEGDKLAFRLEVRPDEPRFVITEAHRLPPDTVFEFRAARPSARQ